MKKWEYYTLYTHPTIGVDRDKLNLLGDKGWELSAALNDELIFKREHK